MMLAPGQQPAQDATLTRSGQATVVAGASAMAITAAALPGWSGAFTVLWVMACLTMRRGPAAGLALVAFSVPLDQRYLVPTALGDLPVCQYLAWGLVLGLAPSLALRGRLVVDQIVVTQALVVVTLAASFVAGGVRIFTWGQEVSHWLLALLVLVVARSLRLTAHERMLIAIGAAAGVAVASATAFYQLAGVDAPESYYASGALRVFGTFTHPNTLAGYLALTVPLLAMLSLARGGGLTWVLRTAGVLGAITLVLTQSRGGWLALGVACMVLVTLAPRRIQRAGLLAGVVVLLLSIAAGVTAGLPGAQRLETISGAGFDGVQVTTETWGELERLAHWGAALSMMGDNRLLGVGAGEFNDNYRDYTPEWRFRIGRGHAHNGYLHMGAQAGVPGMVAFAAWVAAMTIALWRRLRYAMGIDYLFAAGALGSVTAYAVGSVFEYVDVPGVTILLVTLVAVGLGHPADHVREPRWGDRPGLIGTTA